MVTDFIMIGLLIIFIVYFIVNGTSININISVKQEFSESDRQLLEDLYNKEGDLKEKEMQETFDSVVQSINDIMLGTEEDTNG